MSEINDIEVIKIKKKKKTGIKKATSEVKNARSDSVSKTTQRSSMRIDLNATNKLKLGENNHQKKRKSEIPKNISQQKSISPYESLKTTFANISEVVIKQEADILEAVTGCQEPNSYYIYGKLPDGEKIDIFKCREFSSCGMRYFCPVNCREFSMKIKLASEENEDPEDEEFENSLINVNKDCKCPCFCCVRPDMDLILTEENKKIGKIEQAFSFCDPVFNIYDKDDNQIFYIEADCCQCGLMCRNNFMGKTDEAHFFIYKESDNSNPVGDILKKAAKSMLSIADNYSVIFPNKSTFEEKILLTIAGIMIDYQYFEKNQGSK